MPLLAVLYEILSLSTDISKVNTSLLPEIFYNSSVKEKLIGSPNILQNDNTIDQSRSSRQFPRKSGVLKQVD